MCVYYTLLARRHSVLRCILSEALNITVSPRGVVRSARACYGAVGVLNPRQRHETVSPVNHSREDCGSPLHPIALRAFSAPKNPRPGLGDLPLHRGRTMQPREISLSLNNPIDQPCADWMPSTISLLNYDQQGRLLDLGVLATIFQFQLLI